MKRNSHLAQTAAVSFKILNAPCISLLFIKTPAIFAKLPQHMYSAFKRPYLTLSFTFLSFASSLQNRINPCIFFHSTFYAPNLYDFHFSLPLVSLNSLSLSFSFSFSPICIFTPPPSFSLHTCFLLRMRKLIQKQFLPLFFVLFSKAFTRLTFVSPFYSLLYQNKRFVWNWWQQCFLIKAWRSLASSIGDILSEHWVELPIILLFPGNKLVS